MERSGGPSVSRGGRHSIGAGPIATSWKRGKSNRRSNDLDALTGLQFIAASCIVIAHLTAAGYAPFGWRFDLAPAGMPLFFTLSGFIIHYVYSSDFARAVAAQRSRNSQSRAFRGSIRYSAFFCSITCCFRHSAKP